MVLNYLESSQMCGAGSDDICGFSWDEGTVGVGNETFDSCSVVWGNWSSWAYSGMDWGNKGSGLGSQVCSAGSNNISGFSWDNGAVGVGNECWGIWVSGVSRVSSIGS
jgi:hypothetical protein